MLATVLLFLALAPAASAQPQATGAPTDPRVARFVADVETWRGQLGIPGLSLAILEDGEVVWMQGFGYADLEQRVPATPDTLYHIASVTKTFTAILVHRLVEQKRLDLDAPVMRYDDTIKDPRIRIKHLLTHTADGVPGTAFAYNPDKF
jgi:CubicO group peptidase (beta-lactamase class C family)